MSMLTDEFVNAFNARRLDFGLGAARIKLERLWSKVPESQEGLLKLKFELHEELDKGAKCKDVLGKAADIIFEASANWTHGTYSKGDDGELIWHKYDIVGDFCRRSSAYALTPNKAPLIP